MLEIIFKTIIGFVGFCFIVWVGFCALMALQKVQAIGQLKGLAKYFGYTLLGIFAPLDFILNLLSSIIFLEFPRYRSNEWLFTARMKRYYYRVITKPNKLEKWRGFMGKVITEGLLNNISVAVGDGNHV
jgi:hypothetical protein